MRFMWKLLCLQTASVVFPFVSFLVFRYHDPEETAQVIAENHKTQIAERRKYLEPENPMNH